MTTDATDRPPVADDGRAWEAIKLEYEHLRAEIEQAIRNQVRILGYGGAVLSCSWDWESTPASSPSSLRSRFWRSSSSCCGASSRPG
ncbi:hypothetical protein [Halosegnis marinus]|uniref:hypothetical protein n=1 Tax=Halosegnis marinus TaxID=3034023 RepID=UPI00361DB14F